MGHHHQAVRATALAALAALFLVAAVASAGATSASPRTTAAGARAAAGPLDNVKHVVVIYEENHSFDNLYGGWEGVNGLRTRTQRTRRRSTSRARRTRACGRTTSTSRRRRRPRAPTRPTTSPARSRTRGSRSTVHPGRRDRRVRRRCRPSRSRTGCSTERGAPGRLHARPGAQVLPGAVPAERRPAEPLRRRERRRRDVDGRLRHEAPADLPVAALRRSTRRYAIADNFFQAAFGGSFLNHQWLIAAALAGATRTRRRTSTR